MADDIAFDFEILREYLKRLTSATDTRISGSQAAVTIGPSKSYWAVSDYRTALDTVLRDFGASLDEAGSRFDATHSTIAAALAEAVETDASIADDVTLLMTMLDSLHAPAPAPVTSAGPVTGQATGTAAGDIG